MTRNEWPLARRRSASICRGAEMTSGTQTPTKRGRPSSATKTKFIISAMSKSRLMPLQEIAARSFGCGIHAKLYHCRLSAGPPCDMHFQVACLAISRGLRRQHHHQSCIRLYPLHFFNRDIRSVGDESFIGRRVVQHRFPIRSQTHQFKCVSVPSTSVSNQEHRHVGAAGINSQRLRHVSFDRLSPDKDVQVSRPMRLTTSNQVPKVWRERRFCSHILSRRTGSLAPTQKIQHGGKSPCGWCRLLWRLVRPVHRSEQLFRRNAVEIAQRSRSRTRDVKAQFARLAWFQRWHSQFDQRLPGYKCSEWRRFKRHRRRSRT